MLIAYYVEYPEYHNIENMVTASTQCQDHLPSNNKEPMLPKPKPARAFQETAVHLCYHAGRHYLVWVTVTQTVPPLYQWGRTQLQNM